MNSYSEHKMAMAIKTLAAPKKNKSENRQAPDPAAIFTDFIHPIIQKQIIQYMTTTTLPSATISTDKVFKKILSGACKPDVPPLIPLVISRAKRSLWQFTLLLAMLLISGSAAMAQRSASQSGNWSSNSTWGNNAPPTAVQSATINNNVTVTVDVAAVCSSLTLNGTGTTSLTISGTNTLTIGGAVTINNGTAVILDVAGGTLTASSVAIDGGSSSRFAQLKIGAGTADISGNFTFTGSKDNLQSIVFTGAGTLKVGGSAPLPSGGTFTAGTGTVNFDGTVAQTIPNGTYNFNNIEVNNTYASGATLGAAVSATNIAGSITVGNINTGSLLNTNNLAISRGASDVITIAEGSILNASTSVIGWIVANGSINVNGTFTTANTNGFSGAANTSINSVNNPTITLGSNSTIVYNAGTQSVTDRNYANIVISNNTGTKTWNLSATTQTVSGDFTISANAPFSFGGTNRTLNMKGDWINNSTGTFTPGTSTLLFNGSSLQTIGGTASTTFNNLTINNAAGISLGNSENVSGTLTLTGGILATTTANYIAVTNTATGAITGYSSSSYINCPLRRSFTNGNSYFFPVGDASNYRPFELNSVICATPVVDVTMSSTGASTVNTTLGSISSRNWYARVVSGTFTSGTVRITESGLTSSNLIGKSTAQSGSYASVGGNSIGSTISSNTGMTLPGYYAVGTNPCTNIGITSATAGASPICADKTTTLTANGVVGNNAVVNWYSLTGGTGTHYGTGTTLANAAPGTYYARVTGDCGTPAEASVTVAAYTLPTFSHTETNITCNGAVNGTITITVTGGGSYTYSLLSGDNFPYSGASPITINNLAPNTYTIKVQNSNGCISQP